MFSKSTLRTSAVAIGLALSMLATTASAQTVLRLGGVHPPQSFETRGLNHFAERVEEKTDGAVVVEVFPAGQLGDAVTMIENVMLGAQDMFGNVADWNSHLIPDYGIMGMPFAFSGIDHVQEFLASDYYADVKQRMIDEKNIRVLADNWFRLPRVLVTKEPVDSLADLEGRKLRMANIPVYLDTWSALGTSPTVIPWAEAYLALRTGVVEGLDSPLASIYPQKFYQAAKHVTMTNHSVAPFSLLISERVFQRLSDEQQQALREAGSEAGDYYTRILADEFSEQEEEMLEAGVTFNDDVDLEPFVERASEIAYELEAEGEWSEGLFDRVQEMRPGRQ